MNFLDKAAKISSNLSIFKDTKKKFSQLEIVDLRTLKGDDRALYRENKELFKQKAQDKLFNRSNFAPSTGLSSFKDALRRSGRSLRQQKEILDKVNSGDFKSLQRYKEFREVTNERQERGFSSVRNSDYFNDITPQQFFNLFRVRDEFYDELLFTTYNNDKNSFIYVDSQGNTSNESSDGSEKQSTENIVRDLHAKKMKKRRSQ